MTQTSDMPTSSQTNIPAAHVRLAEGPLDLLSAQKLRYAVFYEEYGAIPTDDMRAQGRDFDQFDEFADHLVVVVQDEKSGTEKIVGTYRLIRQDAAQIVGKFYTSDEYDLTLLLGSSKKLLELGRSCVLAEYRTKPILNMLWLGIAEYITRHDIDFLFGCASFPGTDPKHLAHALSYLHHFYRAPDNIRPVALPERYIDMNILPKEQLDERRIFSTLPPLIKGYLRAGAVIGDGAVIDHQFNTVDVCIIAQTSLLSKRYVNHYDRKSHKNPAGQDIF